MAGMRQDFRRDLRPRGHGRAILVLAILGLFGCPVFGLSAWIWGRRELARIRTGESDPVDEGRVRAGMILGIVAIVHALVVGGIVAVAAALAYRVLLDFLASARQTGI